MRQKDNKRLKIVIEEIAKKEEELRILKRMQEELEDPTLKSLGLSVRSLNALSKKGISRMSELIRYLQKDPKLEKVRNIGKKTASEILEKINN